MRAHLATYLDDFDRLGRTSAVVQFKGVRRHAFTYDELARLARRFSASLAARGIVAGDHLVLWAENSAEWIAVFFGCLQRGVIVVPLDAAASTGFALKIITAVAPKLITGDARLLARLPAQLPCPQLALDELSQLLPPNEAPAIAGLNHQTTLQILFTSGTTGDPSGIVLTHGNVLASVRPIELGARRYLRFERLIHPLRILLTLPLSHVFGQMMGLWIPPLLRSQLHLENKLIAEHILARIHQERINVLAAVPRIIGLLKAQLELESPALVSEIAAASALKPWQRWWRFRKIHRRLGLCFWAFVSGGGPLSANIEQFWSTLGWLVIQGYGMTESTALITLNHPLHVRRGTIGKTMPGRKIKLAPDGELLVRGRMISGATWSGGQITPRTEKWLATGDLAEQIPTGEYKFIGRKSEIIVTAAGLNLHPEDLEAAFDGDSTVAAVAVLALETANGAAPCAVLALRNAAEETSAILARANAKLAELQQIHHARVWPEPDLPRNSTGKVHRKFLSEWLQNSAPVVNRNGPATPAGTDWLSALITAISGSTPASEEEVLALDSLARVQLSAAIEERFGFGADTAAIAVAHTLGDLRRILQAAAIPGQESITNTATGSAAQPPADALASTTDPDRILDAQVRRYLYPRWPWRWPFSLTRLLFLECVLRPLVWLLAAPKVIVEKSSRSEAPLLIIANHVTAFDGALILYALPTWMRRRVAAAMMGEMLESYRHSRDPESAGNQFDPLGPIKYFLLTWLFNVFPLPRYRNFLQSFRHAGRAMDRGFNILIFPEGTRTKDGGLGRFKSGIGLLVKESGAAVLPVALRGLWPLRNQQGRWFRSHSVEIHVGGPIYFSTLDSEATITARLQSTVAALLQ